MPPLDISDDDKAVLAALLREVIDRGFVTPSLRMRHLERILEVLEAPPAALEPYPSLRSPG